MDRWRELPAGVHTHAWFYKSDFLGGGLKMFGFGTDPTHILYVLFVLSSEGPAVYFSASGFMIL